LGRDDRAVGPGAVGHEAARRSQLVPPEVAAVAAEGGRRGSRTCGPGPRGQPTSWRDRLGLGSRVGPRGGRLPAPPPFRFSWGIDVTRPPPLPSWFGPRA